MSLSNSNGQNPEIPNQPRPASVREPVFWRVEGSLLNLTAVRPVGFFAWNSQSFLQRWSRRGSMAALALARPFLYVTNREFATRLLHTVLRGVSRDRLDLLGEEFFEYFLKPRLKQRGVALLNESIAEGSDIVLVSQGLEHIMRPLAKHLGVKRIVANRLDFRDGKATGRLLDPVIRPRGLFARFTGGQPNGLVPREKLISVLGFEKNPAILEAAIQSAERPSPKVTKPVVHFDSGAGRKSLSVRHTLAGKHILLIGATGFIGKVWLANLLTDLPEIGRIYLLVRHNRASTSVERYQRALEESPVFENLAQRHGDGFAAFLRERIEVVDGDVSKPGLGLAPNLRQRLARSLDVIVNSSGLTDFNPDIRDALATNVRATAYTLDFLRECEHAGLLHLSTCYVVGQRDGRVMEELPRNYTPRGLAGFDAAQEWQSPGNTGSRYGSARGITRSYRRAASGGTEKGACSERFAWGRAGKSNPQEPSTLAAANADRCGHAIAPSNWAGPIPTRYTKSLSESLDSKFSRCESCGGDGRGAAGDRGIIAGKTLSGMERRDQYFRFAFVPARHFFPAAADQRSKVPGHYSGRSGDARDDVDFGRTDRAETRRGLSSGHFGGECLQHGAFDRTHRPGASQILPGAERPGASPAVEVRCDSSFEGALRKAFGAGTKSDRAGHQPQVGAISIRSHLWRERNGNSRKSSS